MINPLTVARQIMKVSLLALTLSHNLGRFGNPLRGFSLDFVTKLSWSQCSKSKEPPRRWSPDDFQTRTSQCYAEMCILLFIIMLLVFLLQYTYMYV